jgi:hypothetical protein
MSFVSTNTQEGDYRFLKRKHLPPAMVAEGEPAWVKRAFDWHFGLSRQVYFD